MVGICQCHIPTPIHYDIFPPGGNMTGGNLLGNHDDGDHDHDVIITLSWNVHTPVQDKKVSSHDFSPTPY